MNRLVLVLLGMRARLPMLAVLCGFVAAIAACSDRSPTGSTGTLELTVLSDRSVYSLATDSGAEPILVNRGSVRVYLPMNEYVFVQRFEAGAWSEPRPWFVVDGIGISFSLEPGDTLRSWPMDFRYVDRTKSSANRCGSRLHLS